MAIKCYSEGVNTSDICYDLPYWVIDLSQVLVSSINKFACVPSVLHLLAVLQKAKFHYNDVLMSEIASQITSVPTVCSTIYSGADQRKHQSSASLAFVQGIHRWSVNSPHKRPVTRKKFPFDDVIRWWFACREIRKSSHAVVNKTISKDRYYFHHVHGVITINSSENICILMPKIRKMANPRHPIAPWLVEVS